ncbi:MAG: valine--tRNA ligase [Magnetococcus sp. DMHC-6]
MMPDSTLPKNYDPSSVEQSWYRIWEERGFFAPAAGSKELGSYCIMIPPPNVTGSLHMGHAFQDTIMDALIRFHRMKGFKTLWQTGTDHAGIATQMVVERQLEAEGLTRKDLGRERFIQRVWDWKKSSGGTIVQQLRRMGASCDWTRERFTMDPDLSKAVREVFVRLYNEDLIYRGKRLVNWDPVLQTAVSDLEVQSEEESGFLWHIRYPLIDALDGEPSFLVVATTRPETLLGDTAVAVHPEDDRYRSLVGRQVILPLTGRTIPIIADTYVDPDFGSGCVKITPAHDFNDYEVGKRHHLPMINIFTGEAILNENAPQAYRGLDRYAGRKRLVADLEAAQFIEKIVPHKLMVPRGDRSKSVLEPYLTDQWFVRVAPLAQEAIAAVEEGRIRFVPQNWDKTYFEWMRHIEDWCISRQIWWGHRIPAWYGPDGYLFVCNCEEEVYELAAEHYGRPVSLTQDPDVLDTWFSSALWPFSTLGWPKQSSEMADFYPTQVLVTGFDIIFFWVARMIMFGLKFTNKVPFHTVYIHGLVRDSEGQKMSKSKGNVLDPLDLIDGIDLEALVKKRTRDLMQPHLAQAIENATRREFPDGIAAFGTDALRFTFASLATQGRDIKFDMGRIEGYRHFCNKLWNAARFVWMNTQELGYTVTDGQECTFSLADRWIRSRLQSVKKESAQALQEYRFNDAANGLYGFLWGNYCDWYLEVIKPVLYGPTVAMAEKNGARSTLLVVLEESLRLLHPLMPYITEELWQRMVPLTGRSTYHEGDSIMMAPWPEVEEVWQDEAAEVEMGQVMAFVTAVRTIRSQMNLPPGQPLEVLISGSVATRQRLERHTGWIFPLAKINSMTVLIGSPPPGCATGVIEDLRLFIPLANVLDLEAEEARLQKSIDRLAEFFGARPCRCCGQGREQTRRV